MLGLVKHLTMVEVAWFQWSFAGFDVPIPDQGLDAGDTTAEEVVARVYADVDKSLWPASELSVRAQLAYLRRESHPPVPELDEP